STEKETVLKCGSPPKRCCSDCVFLLSNGQIPSQRVKTKLATQTFPSRSLRLRLCPRESVNENSGTCRSGFAADHSDVTANTATARTGIPTKAKMNQVNFGTRTIYLLGLTTRIPE